jgi:hypothetical protein
VETKKNTICRSLVETDVRLLIADSWRSFTIYPSHRLSDADLRSAWGAGRPNFGRIIAPNWSRSLAAPRGIRANYFWLPLGFQG